MSPIASIPNPLYNNNASDESEAKTEMELKRPRTLDLSYEDDGSPFSSNNNNRSLFSNNSLITEAAKSIFWSPQESISEPTSNTISEITKIWDPESVAFVIGKFDVNTGKLKDGPRLVISKSNEIFNSIYKDGCPIDYKKIPLTSEQSFRTENYWDDHTVLVYSNRTVFVGLISNDQLKSGKLFYPDGDSYHGSFLDNHFLDGQLNYACGNYYVGRFNENRPHGHGKFVVDNETNLEVYVGGHLNGVRTGRGKVTVYDPVTGMSKISYDGPFLNEKPNGKGRIATENSDYDGMVVDGLMHGYGEIIFCKGEVTSYKGNFYKNSLCGQGTAVLKGGAKLVGKFENNVPSGCIIRTEADGQQFKVHYENGKIVEEEEIKPTPTEEIKSNVA